MKKVVVEYIKSVSYTHLGGLTVNWDKSKFLQTEIHFLGFIITQEGILANPDKVEAIMRFPEPKKIKQLQSFLGLCNFYRKFQENYESSHTPVESSKEQKNTTVCQRRKS